MKEDCPHFSSERCALAEYICPNTIAKCSDYPECTAKSVNGILNKLDNLLKKAITNISKRFK